MSYRDYEDPQTLAQALDSTNSDDLRKLVALTGQKAPNRKGDMAAVIVQHLAGDRLRTVWESLDELQRAAVAETVHSGSAQFEAARFRAKYGRDPNWGSKSQSGYDYKPSALCFFFYRNSAMPDDLMARLQKFVPEPRQAAIATLDQLPPVFPRPFSRWNEERTREEGTEDVPIAVHETEGAAHRSLGSALGHRTPPTQERRYRARRTEAG